jgi:hypothetical protein
MRLSKGALATTEGSFIYEAIQAVGMEKNPFNINMTANTDLVSVL